MSLCTDCQCALCCDGTLYSRAPMQQVELEQHAHRFQVELIAHDAGQDKPDHSFHLPCKLCVQDSCSIHTEPRPAICGTYVCQLIITHEAGNTSTRQAQQLVASVKQLRAQLQPALTAFTNTGGNEGTLSFSELTQLAVRQHETCLAENKTGLPGAILLQLGLLRVLLAKHFDSRLTRHTHEASMERAKQTMATPPQGLP